MEFSIEFEAYNYFALILNYDRGSFGCAIIAGERGIGIDNSQKWYDKDKLSLFLHDLKEDLESRIPDKFLQRNGWLE